MAVEISSDRMLDELHEVCRGAPLMRVMEVCGTHTVAFRRSGLRSLLPKNLRLVSGPGCPVCVSSQGYIDAACGLASLPHVVICTYGDMLRVPGRHGSLAAQRATGSEVRVVYSPMDAVRFAQLAPEQEWVFLAVGFETTIPGHAAAILEAERLGLENFSILAAQKLVAPAMEALLSAGAVPLDGFLCPGHVSVVTGSQLYEGLVESFAVPCVVAGFEPPSMIAGLTALVRQIRAGEARVENVYRIAVRSTGNPLARQSIAEVFELEDAVWRAMGTIPRSGLRLRTRFRRFDAFDRFGIRVGPDYDPPGCRCGLVLQGRVNPEQCPLFGNGCTPLEPIGPCMVSSEGACAAAYRYGSRRARGS